MDAPGARRNRSPGAGRVEKQFRGLIAGAQAPQLEAELQDEARIGQAGCNCRRWCQEGARPNGFEDRRDQAVNPLGASRPGRDAAFGLILPIASTGNMQAFLARPGGQVAPGAHALLEMDRAGWRCADGLAVPDSITPVFLSPCRPELDEHRAPRPCLGDRFLSHRLWPDCDGILDAVDQARQRVAGDAGRVNSLRSMEWARPAENQWGRDKAFSRFADSTL